MKKPRLGSPERGMVCRARRKVEQSSNFYVGRTTALAAALVAKGVHIMGRKYEIEHPKDPYDLTDIKGIAAELAEEATDDASKLAGAVVDKVSDRATDIAESAADEAHAAYSYPRAYAGYALRKLKRRAESRPMETVMAVAATAFLAGALWGVVRRPRY